MAPGLETLFLARLKMHSIDTDTKVCAVIGDPVAHSLSPLIHNCAFERSGLNYVYVAFQVQDVAACLAGMRALPSFRGLSVTIPHKVAVMPHLNEIEPMAQKVGCVNTITHDKGRLIGTTTDGPGTLKAFEDVGVALAGKKVLFVGSGGAVRAVAFAMIDMAACGQVTILGRTPSRVASLVRDLSDRTEGHIEAGSITDDLEGCMASHDIVIQGTPMGMYPEAMDQSPVDAALFRCEQVAFDMVYRPQRTRFLADADAAGCVTISGLHMLVNQAALQFETWTGVPAPVDTMREALLGKLSDS